MVTQNVSFKASFFIFLLCIASANLKGQFEKSSNSGMVSIEGQVLDNDNSPLEFVYVILLSLPDSLVVTGTTTNQKGFYKLQNIPVNKYIIKYQFIGYENDLSADIEPSEVHKNIVLPPVKLHPSVNQLNEVNITGNKISVNQQIDKKVIDVQKDLDAASGNAVDILEKVPAVSVDADKNVSIRGRSDITVLIDGKPSTLKGSDALSAIPASQVDKIEIITNPSAKYEAQGIGGIINIVTKKGKIDGLEGLVNVSAGLYDKLKAEADISYQKGIFNYTGQIKYDEFTYLAQSNRYRIIYNPIIDSLYQDAFNRKSIRIDDALKFGMGIKLPKFTAGIDAKAGYWSYGKRKNGYQDTWTEPETATDYTLTNFASNISWHYIDLSGTMGFIFDKPGHKLDNLISYTHGSDNTGYETDAWVANEDLETMGSPSKNITGQNGFTNALRIQSDYTDPLSDKTTLESGVQADISTEMENYFNQNFDTITNLWVNTGSIQETMSEQNDIYAAYINLKRKTQKLDFQVGLRGEYNYRDIGLNTNIPAIVLYDFQLFPSLSAGYTFSETRKLYAAFSRRINRPQPWMLIPFVQINDDYNSTIGNPGLKPEINNNLEINIEQKWNNWHITFGAFSRLLNWGISQIYFQQYGNNFQYTFINLNWAIMDGVEFHLEKTLWKIIDLNINASTFNYSYNGQFNNSYLTQYENLSVITNQAFNNNSFTWNANTTIAIKITPTTRIQLFGNYNGIMKTPVGENLPYYFVNMSVQQDLWKKKLKINLKADDIFNTMRFSGETFVGTNYYVRYAYWNKPFLLLTLSYNFNNYKTEARKSIDIEKGGF